MKPVVAVVALLILTPLAAVVPVSHKNAKHRRWRIRKEWPAGGGYSCCEYTSPLPCAAADVAKSPSVIEWVALGGCNIDEIYHPD